MSKSTLRAEAPEFIPRYLATALCQQNEVLQKADVDIHESEATTKTAEITSTAAPEASTPEIARAVEIVAAAVAATPPPTTEAEVSFNNSSSFSRTTNNNNSSNGNNKSSS